MMQTLRLCLVIVLCTSFAVAVRGQDGVDAADGKQEGGESFDKVFDEWRETLVEINKLRFRYPLASKEEQAAIRQQFRELTEKAREIEPRLRATIEARFASDPAANAELGGFLMKEAEKASQNDSYEQAVEIAGVLIKAKYGDPRIYAIGAQSAVHTNQHELAEKWLAIAQQRGAIPKQPPEADTARKANRELWEKEKAIRLKQQAAGEADPAKVLPRVKLETSKGDIIVELCEDDAPNTVANFISLVEKGFYNGLKFHRVIPGFMAQGGDPEGKGTGGPGYMIKCELDGDDYRRHFRGSLSMAHAGKDTGGSQFFLTFIRTAHLDGKHTAFGYVVDGFDVLGKIQKTNEPKKKVEPDIIRKATVLRKRDHEYVPEKAGGR